jgi:enediyne biosynthesis protein E4
MGNWSEIRLIEPNANRNAIGAKLAIKIGARTIYRTIRIGGGDASGYAGWVHAGLGAAERAEIRVKWPDGEWRHPYRVFADQFVVIDRTKAQASYWYAGR